MINRLIVVLVCCLPLAAWSNTTAVLWDKYKQQFITKQGRVIDPFGGSKITTSEGQSYAMFFALINNDRQLFEQLLNWTDNNLTSKGLRNQLPAWKYGRSKGKNRILDANSATDSDLWIVYNLYEAAKLWQVKKYKELADSLAQRVLDSSTIRHKVFGTLLLPAPKGFVNSDKQTIRLNPSYLPLQIISAIAKHSNNPQWQQIEQSSYQILLLSAPHGIFSDWVTIDYDGNILNLESSGYEAIRSYVWSATLNKASHYYSTFNLLLAKGAAYFSRIGYMPEKINPVTRTYNRRGNEGFQVSILPLATRYNNATLLQSSATALNKIIESQQASYYSMSLALFVMGFMENQYSFSMFGSLNVHWHEK